ncbi:MAG: peptide deformylase [Chloroflexi bacterium]|jgi:peptide deformylase|nr:peptide deformylase [Chloroflexota bacterium]HLG50582.1 peptide deformylase [Chloroflexota bacterium]
MALREILTVEHPMLRRKCSRIHRLDASLQRLIDDMIETMHHANGVGLAAPQVGVPVRLFVVQTPEDCDEPHAGELFVLYNPEIIKKANLYYPEEGCLSMPGWVANVPRYRDVVIKGRDRQGREVRIKAEGLLAQAFQHETDHLDGILFFDHLESMDQLRRVEKETVPA